MLRLIVLVGEVAVVHNDHEKHELGGYRLCWVQHNWQSRPDELDRLWAQGVPIGRTHVGVERIGVMLRAAADMEAVR